MTRSDSSDARADGGARLTEAHRASVLVAIDLQHVFADPGSPWGAPRFAEAAGGIARLADAFGPRTVRTRWVAPEQPRDAWRAYFELWPFARQGPEHPMFDLVPPFDALTGPIVTSTAFGKWGEALDAALDGAREIVLVGVSTDCCVLSTALAAADAGVHVRIPVDACAGASDEDHARALAAMALYAPLIELTTVDEVLAAP